MKLAEWVSIPEQRQRELIVDWYKNNQWSNYEDMAMEAAASLRKQLAPFADVTNVEPDAGEIICEDRTIYIHELVLKVYTTLIGAVSIEQLPSQFAGFRVQQLNLGDKREAFHTTWRRLFKELKGWDESETLTWAVKWADALSGRQPSAIYHYGPVKTALSGLVDEKTKKLAGGNLRNLYIEMTDVLENAEDDDSARIQHPDTMASYDWEYARRRTNELIAKYTQSGF
jgi:hypothetical protein